MGWERPGHSASWSCRPGGLGTPESGSGPGGPLRGAHGLLGWRLRQASPHMCPRGPSTTSCGSCPRCRRTCPCACWGTTATWASTASSCPVTCATSSTTWTGGPTPAPRHTRPLDAPLPPQHTPVTPGCARDTPSPLHAPVPLDTPAAPPLPEPRPPLQLQGPRPSWRQTWAGSGPSSPRVQQECCPPPWGAWVGWAVRSCRDRRLQWPGLGVHRRAPRLAKLSEPNVSIWDSGPITCWSTQRPGALPPGRLGLGASSAQRACPSCLSLSCLCSFANRPPGSSYFRYAESSMKNSFGLKYLHRFFNIPFLQLQVSAAGRGRAWSHQSGCPRLVGELDRSGTTGPAVGPPCVRAGASQRHGPRQPPAPMAAPLSPPWAWALCRQLQGLRSPRLPPPGWLPSLESRSPFCWGMRLGLQKKQRLPVPWLSSPPPAPLAPHVAVAALQPAVAPETCLVRGLTLDQWWAFKASPRR